MNNENTFDLIVIGTGPAGSYAALRCREAGWNVALAESRLLGGTCALRGCDPKKVLLSASETLDAVRRLSGKGVDAPDIRINWPDLMRFKRSFTETVPAYREKEFTEKGIRIFTGTAHFTARNRVRVGDDEITGKRILIATGARPSALPFEGAEYVATSDQFLELNELPRRIVFVGGGYISFEFAHLAVRAGASVRIIEQSPMPLQQFDPDLTNQLIRASHEIGIDVQLNTTIEAIEKHNGNYQLHLKDDYGKQIVDADLIIHGAGRVPNVEALELANAGIRCAEGGGIMINDYLQCVDNEAVFAAGDASNAGAPLTPVASMQATILVENWLENKKQKVHYPVTPAVVFTAPPMASVGWLEDEAKQSGDAYHVRQDSMANWFPYKRINQPYCGYKLITDAENQRILGAHLLGQQAEEMINLFAMAMQADIRIADLKHIMYAYPTHGTYIRRMLP